jgi:hypothetical protein
VQEIVAEANGLQKPLAYSRWNIIWLVAAAPYYFIISCLMRLAQNLATIAGAHDFSKRCWVLEQHYNAKIDLMRHVATYGDKLLYPSTNCSAWNTEDVYLHPKMSRNQITDKEVLRYLNPLEEIDFYSPEGVCHGMVDWFLMLYNKTAHYFTDREEHLIAVAKQFMDGAPRQATFLQAVRRNQLFLPSRPIMQISTRDPKANLSQFKEKMEQQIEVLVPGIYGVYIVNDAAENLEREGHIVLYIKTDTLNSYIFDPNLGLVKYGNVKEVQTHFLRSFGSKTSCLLFHDVECGHSLTADSERSEWFKHRWLEKFFLA